jgi:hypothetical protein
MQFTLLYDGPLSSSGNSHKKADKWALRKAFDPQLRQLWKVNQDLANLAKQGPMRVDGTFLRIQPHHTAQASMTTSHAVILPPPTPRTVPTEGVVTGDVFKVAEPEWIDLCEPISIKGVQFLPLVRNSLALTCGLRIRFHRPEARGRVFQGGDLDGRLKLLLDALSMPQDPNELCDDPDAPSPIYCLLENDALIVRYDAATERLLNGVPEKENYVHLSIEVDVRVSRTRHYNEIFLSD